MAEKPKNVETAEVEREPRTPERAMDEAVGVVERRESASSASSGMGGWKGAAGKVLKFSCKAFLKTVKFVATVLVVSSMRLFQETMETGAKLMGEKIEKPKDKK